MSIERTRHPCPPLPLPEGFQASPLQLLDPEPDDCRVRCWYCIRFGSRKRFGKVSGWCLSFDDWAEPYTLHHCDRFHLKRYDDEPSSDL